MANNLAHTKWVCKYHIVFTPKYRRKIIYHLLWGLKKAIRFTSRVLTVWGGIMGDFGAMADPRQGEGC